MGFRAVRPGPAPMVIGVTVPAPWGFWFATKAIVPSGVIAIPTGFGPTGADTPGTSFWVATSIATTSGWGGGVLWPGRTLKLAAPNAGARRAASAKRASGVMAMAAGVDPTGTVEGEPFAPRLTTPTSGWLPCAAKARGGPPEGGDGAAARSSAPDTTARGTSESATATTEALNARSARADIRPGD